MATALDLYRAGDFQGAEDAARTALRDGEDVGLRHLLGVLLCRRENLTEGVEHLRRALELAPGHPAIRISLVRALIDLGQGEAALAHARRPVPGPGAVEWWRLRAEAADAANALPERIEAERHAELEATAIALARTPGDRGQLLRRARLLGALRRDPEAEQLYRQLLDADAGDSEAVRELGLLLERANRLDELRQLVDSSDAAGVGPERLALLRAFLAWRERDASETLCQLGAVPRGEEPVRSRHLEAKAEDLLGNADAAFNAAQAMNDAVPHRERWRGIAAANRDKLRALAGSLDAAWASGWIPGRAGARRPPAFLVGFPRSGTTLLDTFLMGHPDVAVLEEIPLMGMIADLAGPIERSATIGDEEADRLRTVYFDHLERQLPDGFGGLVIDKMPLNMLCAPLIHRLFPDAPILFMQRHPCDVVLSGYLQSFNMNPAVASMLDLEGAADLYEVAMDLWTRSAEVLPLNVHTIAYEKLVADPDRELRAIVDFLELEWDDAVISHRRTAVARGMISTASYDQVTEALSSRASGRWRRYEKQLQPVLPILLPWASRLGYGAAEFPNSR